ncbi:maltase 1-like [Arctopsyche grandis]|uniref:maltase 1-like n=1 Tax=Arctopsyche grandis TaxID=121162 RepID=UPI00406D7C91
MSPAVFLIKSLLIFNLIPINFGNILSDPRYYYQVYIKSFKDADGDGIGDINGVIYGLNHIRSLGVNSIILSPSFESVDECEVNGIKNFYNINAQYGTEENMNELIKRANKAGIQIILDLNLDQTSVLSDYFLSSSRKEIGYEDFYIWKDMDLPIPYESSDIDISFSWRWNENRKEYYLVEGNDTIGYPVLNYKSRKVIEEIENLLIFWMERDISGFRLFSRAETFTDRAVAERFSNFKNIVDNYSKQHGGKRRILIGEFKRGIRMLYKSGYERIQRSFHLVFAENLITQDEKSSARDIKFCVDEMMTYSLGIQTLTWMVCRIFRLINSISQQYWKHYAFTDWKFEKSQNSRTSGTQKFGKSGNFSVHAAWKCNY